MNKKYLIIIIVAASVIVAVGGLRFLSGPEDTWICQNYEWVKHGNPDSPKPVKPCYDEGPSSRDYVFTTVKGNSDVIRLIEPLPLANETFGSPLDIRGEARGTWYFEANFPVKILSLNGEEIAAGIASAQGNWMTGDYVPFEVKLDFLAAQDMDAILVFKKDNPSGLPDNDDQLEIPVRLAGSEIMAVKVFFNNSKLDPEFSCNKVFPLDRAIAATQAPARAALELLLAGNLTDEEKADGFGTSINPGVRIQGLAIEDGTARVDFSGNLEEAVGGSCRVSAIRAQITQTLTQFPSVKDVVISVNGRIEDILQP
ncbi:MAG: GerMN domain-containing protein [Candidatus Pacebacteria bacterium]|nr:GerMN domain-containing protein [Candidatus Paceibacterota bacterium]